MTPHSCTSDFTVFQFLYPQNFGSHQIEAPKTVRPTLSERHAINSPAAKWRLHFSAALQLPLLIFEGRSLRRPGAGIPLIFSKAISRSLASFAKMDASRPLFQIYRDAAVSQTLSSSVSQDGSLPVLSDDEEVHHETLKIQYFLRSATPGGRRRSVHERQPTPHVSGPPVRLVVTSPVPDRERTPRPRQERLPANSADLEEGVIYTLCASPRPASRARSALGGESGYKITTTIEPAGERWMRSVSPQPAHVTTMEYERTEVRAAAI